MKYQKHNYFQEINSPTVGFQIEIIMVLLIKLKVKHYYNVFRGNNLYNIIIVSIWSGWETIRFE